MNYSEYVLSTSQPYSAVLRNFGWLLSKQLSFNMQMQTQTNWCWAATSTSVSRFYWHFSGWTQCKVAGAELDRTDCCNSTVPGPCNVPWYLDRALTRTKNFVSMTGQVTFATVKAEVDAGRPVGARVGWSGGGGHFMVIYGYSKIGSTEYFDIDDPIYGKSHLTVAEFSSNYQGSGTWTHTYFTKSFKLPIKVIFPSDLYLSLIREVRPLLDAKIDPAFDGGRSAETEMADLGGVQRVYSLGLDSLTGRKGASERPEAVALRVFEVRNETPQAYFDLSDEESPRLLQMSSSAPYLEAYNRALSLALAAVDEKEEAELRTLRVPALNFEALWLSYEAEKYDMIIPLRPAEGLTVNEPLPYDKAIDALRSAAKSLGDMDDEMGA